VRGAKGTAQHPRRVDTGLCRRCQGKPAKSVSDRGIYIDSDMSMTTHMLRTVSSCFAALRRIRSIRRSVSQPVLSLDRYLAGSVATQLRQRPCSMRHRDWCKYDRITPLLRDLHWLRVLNAVSFRLAVLAMCSAAVTRLHLNTSREPCSGLMTTSLATLRSATPST